MRNVLGELIGNMKRNWRCKVTQERDHFRAKDEAQNLLKESNRIIEKHHSPDKRSHRQRRETKDIRHSLKSLDKCVEEIIPAESEAEKKISDLHQSKEIQAKGGNRNES
jgi:hypothetical protein